MWPAGRTLAMPVIYQGWPDFFFLFFFEYYIIDVNFGYFLTYMSHN